MSTTVGGEICPTCKHTHTGPELGWICIGCPCKTQPRVLADRLAAAAASRAVPEGDEEVWEDEFWDVVTAEHEAAHDGSLRYCSNQVCRFMVRGS